MSSTHAPNDKGAAFVGLIVTAAALAAMVFGIVVWTNARYANHEGAKAEATTAH
jgi:hypothetical protein